ncbi:MAG: XTP/dITP diphosphatase [Candidatus Bathyarchaeota archaeon]|nr:MAG: XTP/dITP diphosphatase [Candidatus Bathyarchaeota archaeon]
MKSFPWGRVAFFVTGNTCKFDEARMVLAEYNVATAMLRVKAVEIQDDSVEEVAKVSAIDAAKKCGLPIIVEDAGLFIEGLKGFPGSYSSYVYRTIGTKGILELMENVEEREAYFHSVVAFSSPDEPPRCFHGKAEGKISREEKGSHGFGFDPIFKPLNGHDKTFAEMTKEGKNKYSHRALALGEFAEWYTSGFQK